MRGGARPGSGRKKGNKKAETAKGLERTRAIATAEQIIGNGLTPLKFLIDTMRDSNNDIKIRLDAAKDAAGYVHCRKPQEVILQAEVHIDGVDIVFVGK